MNWFNILKVLGTKSGYAQLDFDNIVEEDDDNCYRRLQKVAENIKKLSDREFEGLDMKGTRDDFYTGSTIFHSFYFNNSVRHEYSNFVKEGLDEEVYCGLIDAIKSRKRVVSNDLFFFRYTFEQEGVNNKDHHFIDFVAHQDNEIILEFSMYLYRQDGNYSLEDNTPLQELMPFKLGGREFSTADLEKEFTDTVLNV
jgi:hypothetical protein